MTSLVVDSSVWISYFEENAACKNVIEENQIQTPSIVVAEVANILKKKSVPNGVFEKALQFIRNHSIILSLDFDQALKGGKLCVSEKLGFADSIVYSYASFGNELATADKDFIGKPFVKFIER